MSLTWPDTDREAAAGSAGSAAAAFSSAEAIELTARASRAQSASALLAAGAGSLRLPWAAALPGGVLLSASVAHSSSDMPRMACASAALLAAAPLWAARSCVIFVAPAHAPPDERRRWVIVSKRDAQQH